MPEPENPSLRHAYYRGFLDSLAQNKEEPLQESIMHGQGHFRNQGYARFEGLMPNPY